MPFFNRIQEHQHPSTITRSVVVDPLEGCLFVGMNLTTMTIAGSTSVRTEAAAAAVAAEAATGYASKFRANFLASTRNEECYESIFTIWLKYELPLLVLAPKVALVAVAYSIKASTTGPAGAKCMVPRVTRFPKLRP